MNVTNDNTYWAVYFEHKCEFVKWANIDSNVSELNDVEQDRSGE